MVLRDDDVAWFRSELRKNFCPVRTRIHPRTFDVANWTRKKNPARTWIDADQDDKQLSRTKLMREL